MKKILLYLALPLLFFSCDEFLDTPPDDRIDLDEINEKSSENLRKLLVSAYPGRSHWMMAEFSSDNLDMNIKTDWEEGIPPLDGELFEWKDATAKSWESPQWVWDSYYGAIATANEVLNAIENMGYPDELNPHRGEALLCRAYAHFVLVNLFAKHYSEKTSKNDLGIVYMTKPETKVKPEYHRQSVAEIYRLINEDLEEGLPLINNSFYKVPQYHFNKRAALAFAARFNLYYGNYDKTIKYANDLLGSNPVSSLRDWKALGEVSLETDNMRSDAYLKNETASLLAVPCNSIYYRIVGPYAPAQKYGLNKTISAEETLQSICPWGPVYSISYVRATMLINSLARVCFWLYDDYWNVTDPLSGTGVPFLIEIPFTTDETLLCRAEAYILKSDFTNGVADLNTFMKNFANTKTSTSPTGDRTKEQIVDFYNNIAYFTPMNSTVKKQLNPDFAVAAGDQENLIHAVLHLRRVLTMHTGLRWFDVKRYGIEIERRRVQNTNKSLIGNKLTKDDPRRAIQLPQDVINAGLEANPR
jgi:hypothetical protein